MNVDARTLTPGVADPSANVGPSGHAAGEYVEFAYKSTGGDGTERPVAGVWWDNAKTPVAGYLVAFWNENAGGSWEPLRDLVKRYS
jgi:hypothetical protein